MFFLLAAITLTACSSDDNESGNNNQTNLPKRTFRLEVQAANGAKTRALELDQTTGKKLTAYWEQGENVGLHAWYDEGDVISPEYIGFITANQTGNPTTFVGDVEEASSYHYIDVGTELVFTYPNSSASGYVFQYKDGQDGTIEKIATTFDYASATAKVKAFTAQQGGDKLYIMLEGSDEGGNKIIFRNHTAITAFSFEDEEGNTLLPSYFEVNGKGLVEEYDLLNDEYLCFHDNDSEPVFKKGLIIEQLPSPKTIYVAMMNKYNAKTEYTFFVVARKENGTDSHNYKCKVKANLQPGAFYATTLKMELINGPFSNEN